jgi:GDPmannose 4,6-dehydratase
MPTALITGITGQDGSYLAELLLQKGYQVVGMVRRSSTVTFNRLEHIQDQITLVQGNLHDQGSIVAIIEAHRPDEVYNLAAPSFVPISSHQPVLTGDATALGVARVLESIRLEHPEAKFYQASSSEIYGEPRESPQNLETPLNPRGPYGIAKAYGHWMAQYYRREHGIFACSGVLYNHESPRRGTEFVTRKITRGAVKIKLGMEKELRLGNLDARRDWGFAGDYVRAMWLMLQQEVPEDYVICTGKTHSVRDLCEIAFSHLDLDYQDYVLRDDRYYRPAEKIPLVGDASKAKNHLGWQPTVSFKELIQTMVDSDREELAERKDR